MAVKNIKYKPLGASIQRIGGINSADVAETVRGYETLSNRLDKLNQSVLRDVGYESEIRAREDAGSYQAYTYDQEGNIKFNDAPEPGSNVYDRAYYKHVQENSKFQIKAYIDNKLQGAYQRNLYDIQGYNVEKKDIKDGIMSSLQEKNPALAPYFDFDIDNSSISFEKTIFTNQRARTKDVQQTTFENMRDSKYMELLIHKASRMGPEATQRLGIFINEVYHDFVSKGPSSAYVAGGVAYNEDKTRGNIFTAKEIDSGIIDFRKTVQSHYVLDKFTDITDPTERAALLSSIVDGTFQTVDFLDPSSTAKGETLLGTKKTSIGNIIGNVEERMKLAETIEKRALDEKNRIKDYNKLNIEVLEYAARGEVSNVLAEFNKLDSGIDYNRPEHKRALIDRLDNIGRKHPSIKGLGLIQEAKDIINSDNLPTESEPVGLAQYELQAANGVLDTEELVLDKTISRKDKVKLWSKQTQWDSGETTFKSKAIYKDAEFTLSNIDGGDNMFDIGGSKDRRQKVGSLKDKLADFYRDIENEHGAYVGKRGIGAVDPRHVSQYFTYLYSTDNLVVTQKDFTTKKNKFITFTEEEEKYIPGKTALKNLKETLKGLDKNQDETRYNETLEKIKEMNAKINSDFPDRKELDLSITEKKQKKKNMKWAGTTMIAITDKEGNFIGIEPLTTNSIINLLVTDPQGFIGNKKIDYANTFGLGNNYD